MSRPDESARIEAHAERFPESVPGVDEILAGLRDGPDPPCLASVTSVFSDDPARWWEIVIRQYSGRKRMTGTQRIEYRVCSASGRTCCTYHDGHDDPLGHAERMREFLDGPNQVSNDVPHRIECRTVTTTEWVSLPAAADREAPDEEGRICCRGMGADGGCNICAAEATR